MTINCKGNLTDLTTPKIMGIMNVTPDSFFDGGVYPNPEKIIAHVSQMLADGADFIDLGAYSSRPDAADVSEEEELGRILPVVELLVNKFPEIILSIDTFRAKVAEECVGKGAAIINDITAGLGDERMMESVAALRVPYIMMHMRGTPQTMQTLTSYDDLIHDILYYFSERTAKARSFGISDLIIDPGFGFSKTLEQNYELMANFELLKIVDLPILAGVSRKSMVYKLLGSTPEQALNGTSVLNTVALQKGANILRVHDVREAAEAVKIHNHLASVRHH